MAKHAWGVSGGGEEWNAKERKWSFLVGTVKGEKLCISVSQFSTNPSSTYCIGDSKDHAQNAGQQQELHCERDSCEADSKQSYGFWLKRRCGGVIRLSSERSDREMGQQELYCELCAPRWVSSSASSVFELLTVQPGPLQQGLQEQVCPGLCPGGIGASPVVEALQPVWTTCSSTCLQHSSGSMCITTSVEFTINVFIKEKSCLTDLTRSCNETA
ncbi:uncharacterized protein LOC125692655 [Lagopus muta]|uniref:uncharacterized protein LOC125692655 n=1 Tax=Lagopus muta TaxID=64668 RepID=UPI00209FA5DF|nr:uncharacterized protein LOC125692655 [Lagopus muta]